MSGWPSNCAAFAAFMLPPYSRRMLPERGLAACQLRAQHGMHLLRLLGRGGLAGTDGPDRLIGHDHFADAMAVEVNHRRQLARTTASVSPASRSASVSPTQTMGSDARCQRALGLDRHLRIGLAMVLAALRMPYQHIAHRTRATWRPRFFSGVGPGLMLRNILRTQSQRRASRQACTCAK